MMGSAVQILASAVQIIASVVQMIRSAVENIGTDVRTIKSSEPEVVASGLLDPAFVKASRGSLDLRGSDVQTILVLPRRSNAGSTPHALICQPWSRGRISNFGEGSHTSAILVSSSSE
jgi:hypothetical protein